MKRPKQRVAMQEVDARAISDEFIRAQLGFLPACDGAQYRGSPDASWSFIYRIPRERGEVTDPSHWLIEVDARTWTARFFPVMYSVSRARVEGAPRRLRSALGSAGTAERGFRHGRPRKVLERRHRSRGLDGSR